jgi:hypothetical protein
MNRYLDRDPLPPTCVRAAKDAPGFKRRQKQGRSSAWPAFPFPSVCDPVVGPVIVCHAEIQ